MQVEELKSKPFFDNKVEVAIETPSPKERKESQCLHTFCYWALIFYSITVTYLLSVYILDNTNDNVVVVHIMYIKTYLVTKWSLLMVNNVESSQPTLPSTHDIAKDICTLIYQRYDKWLYDIDENTLKDRPLSQQNQTSLIAYNYILNDICKDDDSCQRCYRGDDGDESVHDDKFQYDRLVRCAKTYAVPDNYVSFRHYLLDKEDDYIVTFSEVMSACIHTIPEYLRGFATDGLRVILKNNKLQDHYTLRKWLARALMAVGFVANKIRNSVGGIPTFINMKMACQKVRDSAIMDYMFKAAMYKNAENQANAKTECIRTYHKI